MKTLTLILSILLTLPACASDLTAPQRAEQFFGTLLQGDMNKAYDELFAGSAVAQSSERVEALKRHTTANLPMYGKPLGYELVIEQTFGTSVMRLVYILKMEKHPIVWEFFFYRPKNTWYVANVGLNDEFNGLRDTGSPPPKT